MMRKAALYLFVLFLFSCSDTNQKKVESAISKTGDSLISKLDKVNDTLKGVSKSIKEKLPTVKIERYKSVPISLQWIGFDKPGSAKLAKSENDWFTIKGEQTNQNNEYLKIDGRIIRIDEGRLKFVGTIITYVKYNNDGKPCEKSGEQIFLKKNDRKYYRLQNMENCAGGRLVDYVDLYEIDNYL